MAAIPSGSPVMDVDLAVVGFGKGGKTLIGAMAARGKRVALIEQSDQMYGGTCINIGCVPTKALIHRAEHPDSRLDGEAWFARAAEQTATLTAAMRAANFTLFDSPETSTVVTGRARFEDPHTLVVTAGTDVLRVRAETIVVNTGAEPAMPPIPGLAESKRVVTSTGMLALTERPGELIVLGGGYVGVEFAAMHAAYGTRVTLLQRGPRLLPKEDPEISAEMETLLTDAGVRVVTGAAMHAVTDSGDRVRVGFGDGDGVEADLVLAALGRRPVTEGLGLEEVGIAVGKRGEVVVDEYLRTSLPHVYAVGDVNGGPQFTYISLDDFRIVLDQLTGEGRRATTDRVAVPHTVFTTPPLARVGLTSAEARATGRPLKTAVRRVAEMPAVPRAKIVGDARGVMTAVVDAETDEVLGVTVLAHDAHEVINTVAVGMRCGATASSLRDGIYTHPSMTEALNDLLGHLG
ncbi:putative pyridine nucleotide-disulfide oxidoreductase RclA [Streptomyces sp. RB5]|uniref:Putative pyridine nucleotide-disulfide oxidoreductase RclA n=1 Tax=Streptomyces smaragdinus TaxID=2585196 RepID=A0A7K0CEN3_9ACTN|nr:FAD-dependent oxidoreductase [Streptomyces smaragdinus]MQY11502.1 putative pyridine nucleotide-disulfide oxidoreductase RclA [Streptomyces smaragdinus]